MVPYQDLMQRIGAVADAIDVPAFVVGGAVRDALLGRTTTDLDFVTLGDGSGIRLAEAVAERMDGGMAHVYPNFGTAAVRVPFDDRMMVLEFVGARKESYRRASRKPIVETGSLQDDQNRRDFTINALAIALNAGRFGELIDPFGGVQDLDAGLLRTPLEPAQTFSDDPLRMLRGARFAAQLGFQIEPKTFAGMRKEARRIDIVSNERIAEELRKIVRSPVPSVGFKVLFSTGLLERILPALSDLAGVEAVDGHRHKDNFYHSIQVLDNLVDLVAERPAEETEWLRWAALLHDVGKARTKRFVEGTGWTFHGHEDVGARMIPKIFRRLKLPTDDRMETTRDLVKLHHRPVALVDDHVTDSAVRRLLFDAGDLIDDLMLLVRADITSKNPARVRRYLGHFDHVEHKMAEVEEKDRLRNFQPPVDGAEIMRELGVGEGVAVGIVKERIREAILDGDIPNEYEPAFQYMLAIKDDALRRAALFDEVIRSLKGPERRATGAIKERLFFGDLPPTRTDALAVLDAIKRDVLAAV